MWSARAKLARDAVEHGRVGYGMYGMKHAHFPRSIKAARVVWGKGGVDDAKVLVDVVECPGCCGGMTITVNNGAGFDMPGLMNTFSHSYHLQVDEQLVKAYECFGQRIAPGDYGDYYCGNLVRDGNIFEDMRAAGFDLDDSIHCLAVSRVSDPDFKWRADWMKSQDDLAVACRTTDATLLALHQPRVISLPANEHVSLLLKALSTRLAGKQLVTTVIQCSDFYMVDKDGKRRDSGDDSGSDSGNHSTEAVILTPLCMIVYPQIWRREPLSEKRKERLESVREHFYALVNMHQPTGTGPSYKSANILKKDLAIKFFSDLFGLTYLKNYVCSHFYSPTHIFHGMQIGKITFFTRFSSMMESSPVSDVPPVDPAEGWSVILRSPVNRHCSF
ncbi:hypothetical protein EDD15DRAFT_2259249 [Pisolithus albus]|nr:hypothetical protein EDD15DRAFT_2259249 [Pisolithus albus]